MGVPHSELKPNPGVFTIRLIFSYRNLDQGLNHVVLNVLKMVSDNLQH